jgi:hypothetical protein
MKGTTMNAHYRRVLAVILFALLAGGAPLVYAGSITGSVSLDTSSLSGPFELAFIFTDGSGTGDANNTITLGNFSFGGGSAGAVDSTLSTGGVSGDLASSVTLTDSAFLNIFAAFFMPGSALAFDFTSTNAVDAGGTPDQFAMVLLRSDGSVVDTSDPTGAGSLLTLTFDGPVRTLATYASTDTPAPRVDVAATVPEPSSLLLVLAALVMLPLWRDKLAVLKSAPAWRHRAC